MCGLMKVLSVGSVLCVLGMGTLAAADTIARFDFDTSSDSGTTFSDASGNGHDAVFSKPVTLQDNDPFDAKGAESNDKSAAASSSTKKGNQVYARLGKLDTIALGSTNCFTIEGWIKLAAMPTKEGAKLVQIESKDGGTTNIVLSVDDQGKPWARVYSKGGGGAGFAGTNAIPLDTWTHLALTYDGKKAVVYVNGKQEAEKQIGKTLPKTVNRIVLGNYIVGAIDDVRISDAALSPDELGFHKSFTGESKSAGSATTQPSAGADVKP